MEGQTVKITLFAAMYLMETFEINIPFTQIMKIISIEGANKNTSKL